MLELDSKDMEQMASMGISKKRVLDQIETFKAGIPHVRLHRAAVVGQGILRFDQRERQELVDVFEARAGELDLLEFVPASGAASRMFKSLFTFLEAYDPQRELITSYVDRSGDHEVERFV